MCVIFRKNMKILFKRRINNYIKHNLYIAICVLVLILLSFIYSKNPLQEWNKKSDLLQISEQDNYIIINDNIPYFDESDYKTEAFEEYSELDNLGRCGVAFANVCKETIPTEERGYIGNIKPSGWNQAKYEGVVNSNPPYLYNRCHLIAYCLTGENDNVKNLITGTRCLNLEMLTFETEVARYLDNNKDNHVLYRVTPVFEDDNLLASGVMIEAYSVEDKGKGICFCIYCYNKQPGVEIDYKTGESKLN